MYNRRKEDTKPKIVCQRCGGYEVGREKMMNIGNSILGDIEVHRSCFYKISIEQKIKDLEFERQVYQAVKGLTSEFDESRTSFVARRDNG